VLRGDPCCRSSLANVASWQVQQVRRDNPYRWRVRSAMGDARREKKVPSLRPTLPGKKRQQLQRGSLTKRNCGCSAGCVMVNVKVATGSEDEFVGSEAVTTCLGFPNCNRPPPLCASEPRISHIQDESGQSPSKRPSLPADGSRQNAFLGKRLPQRTGH
jgi:hypothetical protein